MPEAPLYTHHQSGRRPLTLFAGLFCAGMVGFGLWKDAQWYAMAPMWAALAGVGWATINVNSFPMVVELSRGGDVGKYTGFYYAASMAAQTVTPVLSGMFFDITMRSLFPYATIFVVASFATILFVRHGDSNRRPRKSRLDAFGATD